MWRLSCPATAASFSDSCQTLPTPVESSPIVVPSSVPFSQPPVDRCVLRERRPGRRCRVRQLGQCPSTEALPLPQCLEPSAQTGSHLAVPTIIFYVRTSGTCARTLRPLRISYSITSVVPAIV